MKNKFTGLLAKSMSIILAACLLVMGIPVLAEDSGIVMTKDGIEYTLDEASGTASVTGCIQKELPSKEIMIPPFVEDGAGKTYSVISVGESAFSEIAFFNGGNKYSVTLPDGLEKIGKEAFSAVYFSSALVVPDSVTELGEKVFLDTDAPEIVIGSGVETIPSQAFAGMGFMESPKIVLGSSVKNIAADAFSWAEISNIVVNGPEGSLDEQLSSIKDLKGVQIQYNDPNAKDAAWLQAQVDAAPEGVRTEILLSDAVLLANTVRIPAGKDIVLTDEGKAVSVKAAGANQLFVVEKGACLTIETTGGDELLKLIGGTDSGNGRGTIVNCQGTFMLHGGTLQGGRVTAVGSAAVRIAGIGAAFYMDGGVIEDTTITSNSISAAVSVGENGYFSMSGGVIQNNVSTARNATGGGGVVVYGWSLGDTSIMEISGSAQIRRNESYNGGGIYIIGDAGVVMDGGTISGNYASHFGGGVCVAGSSGGMPVDTDAPCAFTMNGGDISGNEAYTGGGIYLNSNYVTLNEGHIQNNMAENQGGGVYVSVVPYTLHMYNAVITGNRAESLRGGLWFCPTGDATLSVTNGAAVFDNTAGDAGDDYVSVWNSGRTHTSTLANRMLGGGKVDWYKDGGIDDGIISQWGVASDAPRYDPTNPGESVDVKGSTKSHALKAVAGDEAKALAMEKGRLFITGNSAYRGGGIGSNGAVVIGEKDRDYILTVEKEWLETPETGKPESVTVYLKVGDHQLDPVVLSAQNEWRASFEELPDPSTIGVEFAVAEDPVPENFTPQYTPAVVDSEARTIYIRLTNTYVTPEIPSKPDSSEPTEEIPDESTPSGAPSSDVDSSSREEISDESTPLAPVTGQQASNPAWLVAGVALAVCCAATVMLCRKTRGNWAGCRNRK